MPDARIVVPSLAGIGVPAATLPDVPAAGRLRLGDVELGAGRPAVVQNPSLRRDRPGRPSLWLADHPSPDAAETWRRLADLFQDTGLWPLVLASLDADEPARPWDSGELEPGPLAPVEALEAAAVLAEGWADSLVPMGVDPYVEHLRPYGAAFPGSTNLSGQPGPVGR
jgi:hypothetical protein